MKKLLLLSALLLIIGSLSAQEGAEEPAGFEFSGSIDAYFRANLNNEFNTAPATSFANLPGFSLGMANLIASYEGEKVGFTADLVFGPRGEDAVFLSPVLRPGGNSSIVNQLSVYWKASDKVTFTLGNFNTFLGYEVISPTGNFNYSTSYMFSYGPFSHTGLKADFDLGSGLSLMLGVFNPTDATEYNPTNDYYGGAQLGYDFGSGSAYLNTLFGDGYFQIDLTAGIDLSETLYLGVNATTANDNFSGIAGYLQAAASENFKVGLRAEYFKDDGIGAIAQGENVLDFTLSGSYTIGNLTLIPELRLDKLSYDGFGEGNAATGSLTSFVLAAVYGF
jgi:hypothetical protein